MPASMGIPGQLSTRCVDYVAMMIAIDRTGKEIAPGYRDSRPYPDRLPVTCRTRSTSAAARR